MSDRYFHSEEMLKRALKTIPLGTQTFSKSKTQYPHGVSPYYVHKGLGGHIWDVDGNEYVDFINGLASITLGYNDPDVRNAVLAQLDYGTIFSLPHPLEVEVSEKFVEIVPCAEMVRFGKNGSDATSGAVRLARAYTGRDHIAVCGYHGWQDWYIGSTPRNKGVPKLTQQLTHSFNYNDIESLHKLFSERVDQFAAVIMEPMNVAEPKNGFLEEVKELTHKNNALLVFDEMVTGFRFSKGGAQELFGVTPDLGTFGKGMANGFPISAVGGRADVMKLMEEIFFSFTFGGETLSLAAAGATMKKLQSQPVTEILMRQGTKIIDGVVQLIKKYDLTDVLSIAGHPSWSFLIIKETANYNTWQIKTLFLQEVFARGILTFGTHNLSYSHTDEDINYLLSVYDQVLPILKDAISNKRLDLYLKCQTLEPLFKLR